MIPRTDRRAAASADEFAQLVGEHREDVLALARSILGNVHDAEDVAQETFLAAMRGFGSLRRRSSFGPWVLAIARRICWKRLRRPGRVVSIDDAPEPETPTAETARFAPTDIVRALGALRSRQRTALLLFHREGKSHAEVARLMGVTATQIRNWIHRARRRMRTTLLAQEARRERGETS